jgi:predicted phosphate transport protein (TIGR00153 family)
MIAEKRTTDAGLARHGRKDVFSKLLPREGNFFGLFNEHGDRIVEGARAFLAMVQNYSDGARREQHASEIDAAEHAGDKITREVQHSLHRTFITPIDREQIHGLINAMDDILDLLQDTSHVMSLYDLRKIGDDVLRLTEISVRCCERVQDVVRLLSRLSQADVSKAVLKTCEEIDQLESDADRQMRGAMSRLFREEPDTRELIKLKAVYEHLESISDRCEDVANLIEGVVLENA